MTIVAFGCCRAQTQEARPSLEAAALYPADQSVSEHFCQRGSLGLTESSRMGWPMAH